MVPQRYLKRVLEVRALMPRSQKMDWRATLRGALVDALQEAKVSQDEWDAVVAEAEAHTERTVGIRLDMKNFLPF